MGSDKRPDDMVMGAPGEMCKLMLTRLEWFDTR